ncbi:MAG TPA: AAA family ATPase [Streptosporangiaceae bacterium]|nr:AAA family ATPase [Streptosporangiaceae bacterium]
MTGRAAELAQLAAAIGTGRPGGVLLAGPAGTGKTRLLREALQRARLHGRAVSHVAATRSAARIPFGAVSGLLPAGGPDSGPPGQILRRAAEHLTPPGQQPALVVGADDAHLLDHESAALLHHLVVHKVVFLVATVRAGAPAPDAVAALWKDELATRLAVPPLPATAMDDLLRQALRPAVQEATRQHLLWAAGGSPLLLRELLAGALADGALVRRGRGWAWKDQPRYGSSVTEIVAERLAGLGAGGRAVLEVVACAEPIPADLLGVLASNGLLDPAAVESAERSGAISCEYAGSRQVIRTAHPIYGEVIRATLPPGTAQRIAGWLAGTGARRARARPPAAPRPAVPRDAPVPAAPALDGLPLTQREHEVALLAASGLTSKAIATRLQLSVRTVNNHLARTYAKAGISSRAGLAALMTRSALAGPAPPGPGPAAHQDLPSPARGVA